MTMDLLTQIAQGLTDNLTSILNFLLDFIRQAVAWFFL